MFCFLEGGAQSESIFASEFRSTKNTSSFKETHMSTFIGKISTCVFSFFIVSVMSPVPCNCQEKRPFPSHVNPYIKKVGAFPGSNKITPKLNTKLGSILNGPDLYIAGVADLTQLANSRPLSNRLWVQIGNGGKTASPQVNIKVYFWQIRNVAGQSRGVITHVQNVGISQLQPGQKMTIYPYLATNGPGDPIAYQVVIDPDFRVIETREDNNRTNRLWTTYPDYALRHIPFDSAP